MACHSWNDQNLQGGRALTQLSTASQFAPKHFLDGLSLQMRKSGDGGLGLPPVTPRLHPDARPQWPPRPASAGDERNRFAGAAAELHGGILAANKALVRRNLGPAIGVSGGSSV